MGWTLVVDEKKNIREAETHQSENKPLVSVKKDGNVFVSLAKEYS